MEEAQEEPEEEEEEDEDEDAGEEEVRGRPGLSISLFHAAILTRSNFEFSGFNSRESL